MAYSLLMDGFCTPLQVAEYLADLRIDEPGSPEVSSGSIARRIRSAAVEIKDAAEYLGHTLPNSEPEPLTNIWLLVELLNVELAAAQIIRVRSVEIDPLFVRQAGTQERVARARLDAFRRRRLSEAFLSPVPLPIEPFATVEDVSIDTPGFVADNDRAPSINTIKRWILRHTAYVRAIAAYRGLNQDLKALKDQQKDLYRMLVSGTVGAYVLRARSTAQYGPALDANVNLLLAQVEGELSKFERGFYDYLFD